MSRNRNTLHLHRRLQAQERYAPVQEPQTEHPQPSVAYTEEQQPPAFWPRGAMLNVRNYGAEYIITLFPEEFHAERPERALRFTNSARCQDFVSRWYMREHYDPRAR